MERRKLGQPRDQGPGHCKGRHSGATREEEWRYEVDQEVLGRIAMILSSSQWNIEGVSRTSDSTQPGPQNPLSMSTLSLCNTDTRVPMALLHSPGRGAPLSSAACRLCPQEHVPSSSLLSMAFASCLDESQHPFPI